MDEALHGACEISAGLFTPVAACFALFRRMPSTAPAGRVLQGIYGFDPDRTGAKSYVFDSNQDRIAGGQCGLFLKQGRRVFAGQPLRGPGGELAGIGPKNLLLDRQNSRRVHGKAAQPQLMIVGAALVGTRAR